MLGIADAHLYIFGSLMVDNTVVYAATTSAKKNLSKVVLNSAPVLCALQGRHQSEFPDKDRIAGTVTLGIYVYKKPTWSLQSWALRSIM